MDNRYESQEKYLINEMSIKSELEIKDEPLESSEEYRTENDMKCESLKPQIEASETCADVLRHLTKFREMEFKIENTIEEAYDSITENYNCEIKTDIDVKVEEMEDLIEDEDLNLKIDFIPSRNSQANENILFPQREVVHKLNDANLENDFVDTRKRIKIGPNVISEIFESSSSNSSRVGKEKSNKQKSEKRKKEENKMKFKSQNKIIKDTTKFECSLCEYKTNLKYKFKRHLLVHSTVKLFKCLECDYECNQKENLKRHLLTHSDIVEKNDVPTGSRSRYGGGKISMLKRMALPYKSGIRPVVYASEGIPASQPDESVSVLAKLLKPVIDAFGGIYQ